VNKTIEKWKEELKTKEHIFVGMKEANNFASGKSLSEEEYNKAIKIFLHGKEEKKTEKNAKEQNKKEKNAVVINKAQENKETKEVLNAK